MIVFHYSIPFQQQPILCLSVMVFCYFLLWFWKGKPINNFLFHKHSHISQFHRSFPGPADVSAAEISLLAQRYYDASNGLCNYIKFHDDVVTAGLVGEEREGPPKAPVPGVRPEHLRCPLSPHVPRSTCYSSGLL